jgi:hypothetical protein
VRFVLSAILMFSGLVFNELHSFDKFNNTFINGFFLSQQEPFYFQKPVPSSVEFLGKVDLSFFSDQQIVSQYRFRLVIPDGGTTVIDTKYLRWSAWYHSNFIEILIPILDREGGYKLEIEYIIHNIRGISKFEKYFYVYGTNPMIAFVVEVNKPVTTVDNLTEKTDSVDDILTTKTRPATDKSNIKAIIPANKPVVKTTNKTTKSSANKTPAADIVTIEKVRISNKQIILVNSGIKEAKTSNTPSIDGNKSNEPAKDHGEINAPDYNKLLAEAIEKKDIALFTKSVQNGAGSEIIGADGGNIFHLIDNTIADEETITLLVINGISINEKDNYGNSPLHSAILSGDSEYVRILLNQGANLNSRNNLELTPLHLAAFLNNENVVNQLLLRGAEINIKGNTGYTALHIAVELNYIALAKDLFSMGANRRIETDQKLTPKAIAKIQDNEEMVRLISKKGSYSVAKSKPASTNRTALSNSTKLSPKYDFKLPYDQELAKKRQFNKVMQTISIPIFALSTAGLTYFKSEANNYFSLSKIAETEEMAKDLYNKGTRYNTYSYISGGVSLASIYEFIHSAIRKKNISKDMRKRFN